jgi:UDP-glucose 4-epimerase
MSLSGTVLVTGGAGFIGSHIASKLVDIGAKVRVIDDLSTGSLSNLNKIANRIDFVEGNLTDEKLLRRTLSDVELVFHEAAIPSVPRSVENPVETHKACVEATFCLLVASRDLKVRRVIYAASSSAYGDQPTLPKVESMPPDPLSPYAVAKLTGEYYCKAFTRNYNLETVCLRYFNVFGPRQDPSSPYSGVISRFISALMSGTRPVIYGDGEQSRDFCYIDNVVHANLSAAETSSGVGHVVNIANGQRVTLNRLLEILKELTGRQDITAEYLDWRAGDVKHSLADISVAKRVLGYEPLVGLEEGLKRTIEWWKTDASTTN